MVVGRATSILASHHSPARLSSKVCAEADNILVNIIILVVDLS